MISSCNSYSLLLNSCLRHYTITPPFKVHYPLERLKSKRTTPLYPCHDRSNMSSILSPTSINAIATTTDELTYENKVYHADQAAPNLSKEIDRRHAADPYPSLPDSAASSPVLRDSLHVSKAAVSSPPTNPNLQEHSVAAEIALKTLLHRRFFVAEYGAQIQHRHGFEELLIVSRVTTSGVLCFPTT